MSAATAGHHRRQPSGLRRLFPVRRRGSAIADAIQAGPPDFHASQALAPLRAKLQEVAPEPAHAVPLTGSPLVPLPEQRGPWVASSETAALQRTADLLRAQIAAERYGPAVHVAVTDPAADDLPPSAFLRAVIHDGPELTEPIGRTPVFAGMDTNPDGTRVAGMYLGTNPDGWFVLDSTDPAWCDDAITALTAMRDALVSGSLRPVPAWADQDGAA